MKKLRTCNICVLPKCHLQVVHVIGSPGSGDYGMEMDMDGMHGEMDDMDDMEGMDGYGDEGVDMVRYDF